jgi:anti-sigma factor RsiW
MMTKRDFDKKCEADEELSAFIDGDMDESTMRELAEHLGRCKACSAAKEEFEQMSTGLSALSGAEPPAYLWSKIRQARESETSTSWVEHLQAWWKNRWKVPVLAAAASAAAVVAMVLNLGSPSTAPDSKNDNIKTANSSELEQIRALQSVAAAEQVYADAIASLEKSLENEKNNYSPEVQQTIDKSVADIDGAIDRCRSAIRQDPKNMDARKKVLLAYQQKVDLLTDLVVDPI